MNIRSQADVSGLGYLLAKDMDDRRLSVAASVRVGNFNSAFHELFQFDDVEDSGNTPGFTYWQCPKIGILIVRGTRTAEQALAQGRDWSNTSDFRLVDGFAHTASRAAENIWRHSRTSGIAGRERLIIFGHSYGGEVATALWGKYHTFTDDPNPTLITIGSPRVCWYLNDDRFRLADMQRYNTRQDPFPRLPFQGQDGLFSQFLVPNSVRINWSRFIHVGQGATLGPAGVLDRNSLPDSAIAWPQTDLIGLLTTTDGIAVTAHDPGTYAACLLAQAIHDGTLDYSPVNTSHSTGNVPRPTIPTPATPAQIEAAVGVAEVARIAALMGIGRDRPFRYRKMGSMHCMVCDEQVIISSRYRKTAQSNARFWNQVWEKWNKVEFGGMQNLLNAIAKNFVS